MKHSAIFCCVAGSALMIGGGCASTMSATRTAPEITLTGSNDTVALATLEPAQTTAVTASPKTFHLGAGDSLGQAIYANYATIARANAGWQYASSPTDSE